MFALTSRKLSGAAIVTALTLAGPAFALLAASAEPAMALCKYGTPHCVDPHRPELPKVGGAQIPPDGWEDPDCKAFRNCNPGPDNWGDPAARKGPSGTRPGHIGTVLPVRMAPVSSGPGHLTPINTVGVRSFALSGAGMGHGRR